MKTTTKCARCQKRFKIVPGEVNAFCSEKCQIAFNKLVGLPEGAQYVRPEEMRYPQLVILTIDRIVRVHIK